MSKLTQIIASSALALTATFASAEQNSGNVWNSEHGRLTIPAKPGATCSKTTIDIYRLRVLLGPDENGYDPVHPKCDSNGRGIFTDASSAGFSLAGRDIFQNPEFGERREDMPEFTLDDF